MRRCHIIVNKFVFDQSSARDPLGKFTALFRRYSRLGSGKKSGCHPIPISVIPTPLGAISASPLDSSSKAVINGDAVLEARCHWRDASTIISAVINFCSFYVCL